MHESIKEQKISTVVIFASSPRQSQIFGRSLSPQSRVQSIRRTTLPRSLAQLSLRGACSTDLHEPRRGFNRRWESVAVVQILFETNPSKGNSLKTKSTPCAPSLQSEPRS